MVGNFSAVPVIDDWQGFDQRLSEIESPWGTNPATRGINTAGKWKCLERLVMPVKGRLMLYPVLPFNLLAPATAMQASGL